MNPTKYRIKVSIENQMIRKLEECKEVLEDNYSQNQKHLIKTISSLLKKANRKGFKNELI